MITPSLPLALLLVIVALLLATDEYRDAAPIEPVDPLLPPSPEAWKLPAQPDRMIRSHA